MATRRVKQVYLPAGADWNRAIASIQRSVLTHGAALIWHPDGLSAFLVSDPHRDLMNEHWIAALLSAAAAEIDYLQDMENVQ